MLSCFDCGASVPNEHAELQGVRLQRLFKKSLKLNDGRLIVHGIFAKADTENNNQRIYPKSVLQREARAYELKYLRTGTALGELDHPDYNSRYFRCLNLANVSHQVLDMFWKGKELWGSIQVLSTPSGLLLRELYSKGVRLGVSSRGWATLLKDSDSSQMFVDNDFQLITFDFVTEPSIPDAYLVPIQRHVKRKTIPDQSKILEIAHLGHGVCAMGKLHYLPKAAVLSSHIALLQSRMTAYQSSRQAEHGSDATDVDSIQLRAPPPAAIDTVISPQTGLRDKNHLDQLLRYSHYIVYPEAAYLDRERHARDYHKHLETFAKKAHVAHQQNLLGGTTTT
ncbi:hypothetical protein CEUSTIGMA_g3177.t1 [Chlamydomonas eustigma]|uniref:Uncharacterized protein n=1 Tax=Chlamydomonas eustigma TaxID=1157962 RepID=A0A250WY12_9CHLO|nr:hypothetical protein CEUSTIGMA_g3177.t1 [Chlamydomonas eustigma]|eukprot:GAX75734.1 hypothetical protein CEUSTIGMA_g3177.t1 [Chlamydomonas eustigma]